MKTVRLPKQVVSRCAMELRQAGAFRGKPIHFGRGRPPAGQVGFIAALARRTGYSRAVIHRVLADQPRGGSPPPPDEQRRLLSKMPKAVLSGALQRLFAVLAPHADPAVWDELQPPSERIDRLVDAAQRLTATSSSGSATARRQVTTVQRSPQDPIRLVRSALLDAVEAAQSLQVQGHDVAGAETGPLLDALATHLRTHGK